MIKLIGILIILVGFILKLDTLAVVVGAGVVTGLVSGMSFNEIMTILGEAFVSNRYMSLFILSLPVIGLIERYGLKERAAHLIGNMKAVTMGKITSLYLAIRTLAAIFSLKLGGHVQFIRPLILPMAEGAAENRYEDFDEQGEETIKGLSASIENYGNFFGQNGFVASAGVLLIVGCLEGLNYKVEAIDIVKASLPMAAIIVIVGTIQLFYFEKKFDNKYKIRKSSNIKDKKKESEEGK